MWDSVKCFGEISIYDINLYDKNTSVNIFVILNVVKPNYFSLCFIQFDH